mgnify:CR=1
DDFVLPIDLVDNGVIEPSVAGPMSHLTLPVLLDNIHGSLLSKGYSP